MKLYRTIVLVVLALALGLWAFFGEKYLERRKAERKPDIRLAQFRAGDIASFTIITSEDTIYAESVGDTTWRIRKPIDWKGDSYRFEVVSRELRTSTRQRSWVAPEDSLRYYTLQYPNARLIYTFKDESAAPETLDIGGSAADEKAGYVKFASSDTVIRTNVAVHQAVARRLHDFRDKSLFEEFFPEKVQRISFRMGRDHLSLERRDGRWRMTEPIDRWASPDTVNRLLSRIESARVERFYDQPDRSSEFFGLGESARAEMTVALTDTAGEHTWENQMRLGTLIPALYGHGYTGVWGEDVARTGTVLHLPLGLLKEIDRRAENYWDRRVAIFERRLIDSVAVIRPNETISLWKDSLEYWHMSSPRVQEAYRPEINHIVALMDRIRAYDFTGQKRDISNPRLEVRLFNGDKLEAYLKIGSRYRSGVYARGSANDEIVILSGEVFDELNVTPDTFNYPE